MSHLHLQNVKMLYLDISAPQVCSCPSALVLGFVVSILQACSCSRRPSTAHITAGNPVVAVSGGKRLLNSFGGYISKSDQFVYQLNLATQECIVSSRRLFQHAKDLQERGGPRRTDISISGSCLPFPIGLVWTV